MIINGNYVIIISLYLGMDKYSYHIVTLRIIGLIYLSLSFYERVVLISKIMIFSVISIVLMLLFSTYNLLLIYLFCEISCCKTRTLNVSLRYLSEAFDAPSFYRSQVRF
jgi:hypothetical protein